MPKYLNTRGDTSLAIAVCGRCKMKRAYSELRPDGNIPGLRVCGRGCSDNFDPYRLPAIRPDRIALRFPRPDTNINTYSAAPPFPPVANGFILLEAGIQQYILQESGLPPIRIQLE